VVALAGAQDLTAQSPSNPWVLDGLVVTVSPTPRAAASIAQHVTVLEGSELRLRGLTLADALRDVSGIDVVRNGSFGGITSLFMRGGESDYTLVMIDGVQVNQAGGGFDFSSLTTQNVERVEIVRGPGSALHGSDAMAGVIHVITRLGSESLRGSVRMEGSIYDAPDGGALDGSVLSAELNGGTDRARYSAAVARDAAQGIYPFNSRHESLMVSGAARFLPDDRTRVGLTLRAHDRQHNYPTNGSGAIVDRNAFFFEDETVAHLSVARALTPRVELEVLLGLAETDSGTDDAFDDPSDAGAFKSLDHFRRATARFMSHVRAGTAVVTLGGEVEEERQRSFSESLSSFGPFYGRSESERVNLAVFGHATRELGLVSLALGGRLEDNERFGSIATWQAGVAAHLPDRPTTRLRLSAGSAIKEPTFAENYASGFAVGNPDLDPEWSLEWEAGVEHEVVPGLLSAAVTYFDQAFEEVIQFTFSPPMGGYNYYNMGAATSRGVELDAEASVGTVELGAAWTWLDTEVTDAGLEGGPGDLYVNGQPLIRRPEHSFTLRAATSVGTRVRLHTRLGHQGARADRDFGTFPATPVDMPSHAVWSLGGEWALREPGVSGPAVTLYARAENLLDEDYQETIGFAAPGRQLYFGASVDFGGGN